MSKQVEGQKFVLEQRDEIEVYAGQHGHVCIKQNDHFNEEQLILIHPDDIPKFVKFLEDAAIDAKEIRVSLED